MTKTLYIINTKQLIVKHIILCGIIKPKTKL